VERSLSVSDSRAFAHALAPAKLSNSTVDAPKYPLRISAGWGSSAGPTFLSFGAPPKALFNARKYPIIPIAAAEPYLISQEHQRQFRQFFRTNNLVILVVYFDP